MKLEFNERAESVDITLVPESIEEMMRLLRFSANALQEKPEQIFMSFAREPYCYISLKKRKSIAQTTSIKPNSK